MKISNQCKAILKKVIPRPVIRGVRRMIEKRRVRKLQSARRTLFDATKYPAGVNLIANIRSEIGLGQSARLVANELAHADVSFGIYNYEVAGRLRSEDHSFDGKITKGLHYNVNLIHINPYEMSVAYARLGKKAFDYRYNIAFWLWELEDFPNEWTECISLFDEVWTPSEFSSISIRKKVDIPVRTIPYCVTAPVDMACNRDFFGLPRDKFLFLIMYDSNSTMDRKNPLGAFSAYQKAFSDENVGLVVKVNNADSKDLKELEACLQLIPNSVIINKVMDKNQVNSLITCVDVYVSLHRAEGFGLVMAEAMLLETPVIATNWSSNTEFMNNDVACMVDYKLIPIEKTIGHYNKGQRWAEANVGQASKYMKRLYEDREFYEMMRRKGKRYIEEQLSMEQAVEKIEGCLAKVNDNIEEKE
jgi:Glycosyltransferase